MTVEELAETLSIPPARIIQVLMGLGEMKTVDSELSDQETELIYSELGYRDR